MKLVLPFFLALILTGCASDLKEYNPKMGLLDELALLEPANHITDRARSAQAGTYVGAPRAVAVEARPTSVKGVSFQWPLHDVQITSPYGQRGREFHEGLDLRAKLGTPVYAAHAGQVLYAGERIHGYGRMVVIKHTSGIATIYAHNSRLAVRKGQWVSQGTLIAYSGNTGHSSGPHLHFEVRSGVATINPLSILPKLPSAAQAHERVVATKN